MSHPDLKNEILDILTLCFLGWALITTPLLLWVVLT